MIAVEQLKKSFGRHPVLRGISMRQQKGETTVIIGPSGCGKSTFLRCLNQLETIDAGQVTIAGIAFDHQPTNPATQHRLRLRAGMVFQSFNLFPHLTVLQNIVEAPLAHGVPRQQAEAEARTLLARVGLSSKADEWPRRLSGGQQQRVAIARALALKPKVLLFDEPTSALDPELVNEVLEVIRQLADSGTTLLIVTHEIGFAREVADTIVFMDGGRIVESGAPSQVLGNPSHPRTREFLSKVL